MTAPLCTLTFTTKLDFNLNECIYACKSARFYVKNSTVKASDYQATLGVVLNNTKGQGTVIMHWLLLRYLHLIESQPISTLRNRRCECSNNRVTSFTHAGQSTFIEITAQAASVSTVTIKQLRRRHDSLIPTHTMQRLMKSTPMI